VVLYPAALLFYGSDGQKQFISVS